MFGKAPKAPPPPPSTPTRADASVILAGQRTPTYSSLMGTGSLGGLKKKANTIKSTLIGGSQ